MPGNLKERTLQQFTFEQKRQMSEKIITSQCTTPEERFNRMLFGVKEKEQTLWRSSQKNPGECNTWTMCSRRVERIESHSKTIKGKKTLKKPSVFYECTFDIIRRVRGGLGRSECGYRSSPGPRQGDRCPTRDVLRLSWSFFEVHSILGDRSILPFHRMRLVLEFFFCHFPTVGINTLFVSTLSPVKWGQWK